MTPVSLAPVTPAVRGGDSGADSAKTGDNDDFASLLGRASEERSDNRGNTSVHRENDGASKHRQMSSPAIAAKKHCGDDSRPDAAANS